MPTPTVLWAQRNDKVFLTIDVQDVKEPKVTLSNEEIKDGDSTKTVGKLLFSGVGSGATEQSTYTLDLTFFKALNKEESKINITPRHIQLAVMKAEPGEHWPRLTHDTGRHLSHIKCDWDKWVDEDEEEEKPDFDMSQFSNFNDFAGPGDLGDGADDDDSDDDAPPDLETSAS